MTEVGMAYATTKSSSLFRLVVLRHWQSSLLDSAPRSWQSSRPRFALRSELSVVHPLASVQPFFDPQVLEFFHAFTQELLALWQPFVEPSSGVIHCGSRIFRFLVHIFLLSLEIGIHYGPCMIDDRDHGRGAIRILQLIFVRDRLRRHDWTVMRISALTHRHRHPFVPNALLGSSFVSSFFISACATLINMAFCQEILLLLDLSEDEAVHIVHKAQTCAIARDPCRCTSLRKRRCKHCRIYTMAVAAFDQERGGGAPVCSAEDLEQFTDTDGILKHAQYRFLGHGTPMDMLKLKGRFKSRVNCEIDLNSLSRFLSPKQESKIAQFHGASLPLSASLHKCGLCRCSSVFEGIGLSIAAGTAKSTKLTQANRAPKQRKDVQYSSLYKGLPKPTDASSFPPIPLTNAQKRCIIDDYCLEFDNIAEVGCAVCGILTPASGTTKLSSISSVQLQRLHGEGFTRRERQSLDDPVVEIDGPVLAPRCENVCLNCTEQLHRGNIPENALANGTWVGEVPEELKDLRFAERMLISLIRFNRTVVRVSSGRMKMTANAIMFMNPVPVLYSALPPPRKEIEEVLAFIFVGAVRPGAKEFERTPMLVRRNVVRKALNWLKLNNKFYENLDISETNLEEYGDNEPIVQHQFQASNSPANKDPNAMSVDDREDEEGTAEGPCPFTVHGMTGEDYVKMTMDELKKVAAQHLTSNGDTLKVPTDGEIIVSMYNDPKAYPGMFPHLFPYGYGGLGFRKYERRFTEKNHRTHLMMYYDKRFQTDPYFPMIAFNHSQMKSSSRASFLVSRRSTFPEISKRLRQVETIYKDTLSSMIARMKEDTYTVAETEGEKICEAVLRDLDHVGGQVEGSTTGKKFMRRELWSLMNFIGAPSWFVTFAPADNKHPLCLFFAETGEICWQPDLQRTADLRSKLFANNPVAAARFFNFMVRMFIKHMLGIGPEHDGLFGQTSAFYGTVEQQGRLTLHLHLMLWIHGALSPKDIKDKLKGNDLDFQKSIIDYLEQAHQGGCTTDSLENVRASVRAMKESQIGHQSTSGYIDPTLSLPRGSPAECTGGQCEKAVTCQGHLNWDASMEAETDDILQSSNFHECGYSQGEDQGPALVNGKRVKTRNVGCLNKAGLCKARFPREIVLETKVEEGSIILKKSESMMNSFAPVLTYLSRCNTDVTCLLSGTAVNAVIYYVTKYVSKGSLKTYQMFSAVYDIFQRAETDDRLKDLAIESVERQRLNLLKIANLMNSRVEIGSPMAAMYLLGNPDHYTSHVFKPFWWRSPVEMVENVCAETDGHDLTSVPDERVIVSKHLGNYVALSLLDDYQYRPSLFEDMGLYEWFQVSAKMTRKMAKKCAAGGENIPPTCEEDEDEDENYEDEEDDPEQLTRGLEESGVHEFGQGHPLFDSHMVKVVRARSAYVVPNFMGGLLPRQVEGSDEYEKVMLTLFKPWRQGTDLKNIGELWGTAFARTLFTDRSSQIMRNLKVRYECWDAKDDYYHQMQGAIKDAKMSGIGPGSGEDAAMELNDESLDGDLSSQESFGTMFLNSSKRGLTLEMLMSAAGFCKKPLVESTIHPDHNELPKTTKRLNPVDWAKTVKIAREKELESRKGGDGTTKNGYDHPPERKQGNGRVEIVSADWFLHNGTEDQKQALKLMDTLEAKLNEKQRRAFRLVALHSIQSNPEQLKMYLGGVGGTGKTKVINTLRSFFEHRGQSGRMAVCAPTGAAASLLNGSTYHYLLGIRMEDDAEDNVSETTAVANAKQRLSGVEYLFLDEVSMLSCKHMHIVSSRLANTTGQHEVPFGGMNMILAGDFAQLPPVRAESLYSRLVAAIQPAGQTMAQQENVLGMVLWHQFTTVVILEENMRLKGASEKDKRFAQCLMNMRFGRCSQEDLDLLDSMRAQPSGPKSLQNPLFRFVSVITGWNDTKDRLNSDGGVRFASETMEQLYTFYSVDSPNARTGSRKKERRGGLSKTAREALWMCPPTMNDKFVPAILQLCRGMPVMLRCNDATELCITKGQQGTVLDWDESIGSHGLPVLETVYVSISTPPDGVDGKPRVIQFPGLPQNVVPIPKSTSSIWATYPNGREQGLRREQVNLLPNFGMTAHASQGATRQYNSVELSRCFDNRSYYTALSRGTSADKTLIIGQYEAHKIQKRIDGGLQQEFRHLALLDEITMLAYERRLPPTVKGYMRWAMLDSYHKTFPGKRLPGTNAHWLEGPEIRSQNTGLSWHILNKPKRKRGDSDEENTGRRKKNAPVGETPPIAFIWDAVNFSCGYDAMFSVLYELWCSNPPIWSVRLTQTSALLGRLASVCPAVALGRVQPEHARDGLRTELTNLDPVMFPPGREGITFTDLVTALTSTNPIAHGLSLCLTSKEGSPRIDEYLQQLIHINSSNIPAGSTTQKALTHRISRPSALPCLLCGRIDMIVTHMFTEYPWLLFLSGINTLQHCDKTIQLGGLSGRSYRLVGVVYHSVSASHFVARIIRPSGTVWLCDGMLVSRASRGCTVEPPGVDLRSIGGSDYKVTALLYVRDV